MIAITVRSVILSGADDNPSVLVDLDPLNPLTCGEDGAHGAGEIGLLERACAARHDAKGKGELHGPLHGQKIPAAEYSGSRMGASQRA